MRYEIDFEKLKKVKKKGFCLCEFRKNMDNSNVCPCDRFLETHQCKCMVFRRTV